MACTTCNDIGCIKCKGPANLAENVAEHLAKAPWPFVSLCMIVRDASKTIDGLLESVLRARNGVAFDEIVIVDTGSEDDTREKWARALTSKKPDEICVHKGEPQEFMRKVVVDVRPMWPEKILKFDDPLAVQFMDGKIGIEELERAGYVKTTGESRTERPHIVGATVSGEPGNEVVSGGIPVRVVFARYEWHHHFAAARNFSFKLAQGKWRMYLDADDVYAMAHNLRRDLALLEQRSPDVNCVTMHYDYAQSVQQPNVTRVVRWEDGFHWKGRIHENLVRNENGPRVVSDWGSGMKIKHAPDDADGHNLDAIERNIKIARLAYDEGKEAGDGRAIGMNAYFIGQWARHVGETNNSADRLREAVKFFEEAAAHLQGTNIATLACTEASLAYLMLNDPDSAALAAGGAIANSADMREGYGALGMAYYHKGDTTRAKHAFDHFRQSPGPNMHSAEDVNFLRLLVPLYGALTYLELGLDDDCRDMMSRIPQDMIQGADAYSQLKYREVNRRLLQRHGLKLLRDIHDFWNWSCEPIKFRTILETLLPASIAELPEIGDIRRMVAAKLPHLEGWEQYQKAYADIPSDTFHTTEALEKHVRTELGRTKGVRAWAESLPKDGPPVFVCSIGAQDCLIESEVMRANPRIHMTAVDVSPESAVGIGKLAAEFPGRVTTWKIELGPLDWPQGLTSVNDGPWCAAGRATGDGLSRLRRFDAVMMFELIEHVPDEYLAFESVRRMLADDGTFFVSCPVASEWIEPYLTGPMPPWHFHGHVRSFSPGRLWDLARTSGFTGDLHSTDLGTLFFGQFKPFDKWSGRELTIAAPYAPLPFDPQSLHEGHVGGSEEAVIRLARALAARGIEVTVYTRRPERMPRIHVLDGVRWRDSEEFDPQGDHGVVLFWRMPKYLLDPKVKAGKYRKFSWLHDLAHGAPPAAYEECEKVIVLSPTAVDEVKRLDKVPERLLVTAQNGIDSAEFPPLRVLPVVSLAEFKADGDWQFVLAGATKGAVQMDDVLDVISARRGLFDEEWLALLRVKPGIFGDRAAPDADTVLVGAVLSEAPENSWFRGLPEQAYHDPALAPYLRALGVVVEASGFKRHLTRHTVEDGRQPHACIWASSPNRGLQHLLAIWPRVRAAVPDATLDIYYDWGMFRSSYPQWAAEFDAKLEELKDSGVKYHGGVSHDVLFEAYRRAGVFSMPSTYVETFCTSAVIAQAAGAWPVVTRHGALKTTVLTGDFVEPIQWDEGTPETVTATEQYAHWPDPPEHAELLATKRAEFHERYLAALVQRLLNPPTYEQRVAMRALAVAKFDWSTTARMFDEIMWPNWITGSAEVGLLYGLPRDDDDAMLGAFA